MPRIQFPASALITNSPLRTVFSGDVVDEEVSATHGSFPIKTGSFISVNRLRSKTSNLLGW
jgi:hypothetical protein